MKRATPEHLDEFRFEKKLRNFKKNRVMSGFRGRKELIRRLALIKMKTRKSVAAAAPMQAT